MKLKTLLSSLSIALFSLTFSGRASSVALPTDPIVPDHKLTPGVVLTTDLKVLCQVGYSKTVRNTSDKTKAQIYDRYHIDKTKGHYEIDHLISLELGGADVVENLWPQSYDTQPYNAHRKDALENYLHKQVCAGKMNITQAQKEIADNWVAAYKKYIEAGKAQ